jgi:hypothetical protein
MIGAEVDLQLEPDEPVVLPTVTAIAPLAELLPADFPLPALIKFCPDRRIKVELDTAADYALSLDVREAGLEGLQAADLALEALNASIKAATSHFAEPADIANRLHKNITSLRAEWCSPAEAAKRTLGSRMYAEKSRLDAIAVAARRQLQADADRLAREAARRAAEDAAAKQAPVAVIEKLQQQAETAVAPPVPLAPAAATAMTSTTITTTWKARLAGSEADADPNPDVAVMTPAQLAQLRVLLRAILDEQAPITAISVNWAVLNARAKADKTTLAIPGLEAFADGGVRAKGRRR